MSLTDDVTVISAVFAVNFSPTSSASQQKVAAFTVSSHSIHEHSICNSTCWTCISRDVTTIAAALYPADVPHRVCILWVATSSSQIVLAQLPINLVSYLVKGGLSHMIKQYEAGSYTASNGRHDIIGRSPWGFQGDGGPPSSRRVVADFDGSV